MSVAQPSSFLFRQLAVDDDTVTVSVESGAGHHIATVQLPLVVGEFTTELANRAMLQMIINPHDVAWLISYSPGPRPYTSAEIAGAIDSAVTVATAELSARLAELTARLDELERWRSREPAITVDS